MEPVITFAARGLDPRSPFVLSIQDLGRQPGSVLAVSCMVQSPAPMGTELLAFEQGAELRLELQLDAVTEGVVVSGMVSGRAHGQCGRCLEDFDRQFGARLTELFRYAELPPAEQEQDEEQYLLVGDLLDIEPVVRDTLISALPFQPVCRVDCLGLCSECGILLASDPEHRHDVVDPRWAALQGLSAVGAEPTDTQEEN
ncbi:MAG: YceD family protein [Angustibacter sp.]